MTCECSPLKIVTSSGDKLLLIRDTTDSLNIQVLTVSILINRMTVEQGAGEVKGPSMTGLIF